jgi:hypothetical protein
MVGASRARRYGGSRESRKFESSRPDHFCTFSCICSTPTSFKVKLQVDFTSAIRKILTTESTNIIPANQNLPGIRNQSQTFSSCILLP